MVDYRDSPAVQIFGDGEAAIARLRAAAEGAGCRILGAARIGALPEAAAGAALLIELDGETAPPGLADLLDWAQREAQAGRRRSVVAAPWALTDLVAAHTPHADVDQLCAPDEAERLAAIVRASRPRTAARLHDIGRDEDAALLRTLAEEAGRVAAMLAALSQGEAAAAPVPGESGAPGVDAAAIRAMLRARRLRDRYFRAALFADPAWDMLLDLMAARLECNQVAVSSLCIAAAVPATTALRWIKALTDHGLFVRTADPGDGRRVHIALSDPAAQALGACLAAIQRLSPLAV